MFDIREWHKQQITESNKKSLTEGGKVVDLLQVEREFKKNVDREISKHIEQMFAGKTIQVDARDSESMSDNTKVRNLKVKKVIYSVGADGFEVITTDGKKFEIDGKGMRNVKIM